ncbi:aminoglycoside phosphotransferase [alpha proteobacterium BAL199]|nr:aminoglycoside phosphotransferase [alpha proteobacterium BAL199]
MNASEVRLGAPAKMSGGAIQENWAFDALIVDGPYAGTLGLVLRTDAPSGVSLSRSRAEEHALLTAAFAAGVTVPEPLAVDPEGSVIGKPSYLMRRASGNANPRTLARDPALDPHRSAITETLGHELARIHTIHPPRPDLDFLGSDMSPPAHRRIAEFLEQLDALPHPYPVIEWAVRWLERNAPTRPASVLGHGDFRCGNLMVDATESPQVTAVLDWEFASWSDPLEDIGWLCARCWRFGADARTVGGIGEFDDFRRGYEAETGRTLDWAELPYWEVLATVRWAIIALHQGERHLSGREFSMELALTARKAAEMEYDLLAQIRSIDEAA